MEGSGVRALVALVLVVIAGLQAYRAPARTRLRQAWLLAAAGFGLVVALNLLGLFAVGLGVAGTLLAFGSGVLLLLSMVSLFLAYRGGEKDVQLRRARERIAQERERREKL